MTNLLTVLPDFDLKPFTHLLPSLERALISSADLLTLDALDVAKRAQVPPGEVKKLFDALLDALHADLGCANGEDGNQTTKNGSGRAGGGLSLNFNHARHTVISTLDERIDHALGGGISTGYLTEVVGESAVGKTQFLLTLLLSVQLPSPGKGALYISTEAPLQTTRLAQILKSHPKIQDLPPSQRPSLSHVHSTHVHDVEAQEHILRYQVPVAIKQHNIGILVIDSIAANYRAENDKTKTRRPAESFAKRSNQLSQIGALLREIARANDIAVVVANQVADRFAPAEQQTGQTSMMMNMNMNMSQMTQRSRPDSPAQVLGLQSMQMSQTIPSDSQAAAILPLSTDDPLSLDHQQRFFTGWGDDPSLSENLKTPSLGLTWTNQLATRIALLKQPVYDERIYQLGEDREIKGWKRTAKVVFCSWCAEGSVGFEIWEGGVRGLVGPG